MTASRIPDLGAVSSPPRVELVYEDIKDGEVIGSGGEAIVKRADLTEITGLERVAVKEPHQAARTVDKSIQRAFFRESETWRRLDTIEREKPLFTDSEHIVGVVDAGEKLPWIAMEYMDGGDLNRRLVESEDGLDVAEALWIGECLCRGVKLAHDNGVAHLDLKPANVLFKSTGSNTWDVPKIADWGLSKSLLDHSGSIDALSVEYAAPEQFDSERFGSPDKYTDLYQLGAVLYAMLTGEPPYTGSQTSVMHDVVYGDNPEPPSSATSIPKAIDEVIMPTLSRDKRDRYHGEAHRLEERLKQIRNQLVYNTTDESRSGVTSSPSTEAEQANSSENRIRQSDPRPDDETPVTDTSYPFIGTDREMWKVPCPYCSTTIHNTKTAFVTHWSAATDCQGPEEARPPDHVSISTEEWKEVVNQIESDSTLGPEESKGRTEGDPIQGQLEDVIENATELPIESPNGSFPWLDFPERGWKVPCPYCGSNVYNGKEAFLTHWREADECDGPLSSPE